MLIRKSSRRSFLKTSAALAAAIARPRFGISQALSVTPVLRQFGYGDIQLLDGLAREQFERNHAFYRNLNEDSLLKPFRQRAGLPAPGDDMGGWYSWAPIEDIDKPGTNGFAPGHSFGQYLSALARYYAATGDAATQAKVNRLVRGLGEAISPHFWDENRFPAYTYDKISIGMIDAHEFADDQQAFKVLDAALASVEKRLPPGGISRAEQYQRPHINESFCWDEPYTLPENQFLAWRRGAGDRYRDLGAHFLADNWYWDPLAAGENVLPGKHAYSHVNAMSSAMQAYFVLGDDKYLRAARNGFDFVRAQSFATGGWGPGEEFRKPGSGDLGTSLTNTHSSFETPCGSYAHFKITRYLLRTTKDSRYGDSMERVFYNCILGAKPIKEDGHGFYYSDYNNDGSKVYHPYKWHCCTGTFAQITADYGISSYFHDDQSVYVNLFVPSRATWNRGNHRVVLTQQTEYPLRPATQIEVSPDKNESFGVFVRIPEWAGPKTSITVNGNRVEGSPHAGQFARIHRRWSKGDRIEVEFDMPTRLEAVDPQHPKRMAAVHGPLALFAVGEIPATIRSEQFASIKQASPGSAEWRAELSSGVMTMRPFTSISDQHYRLYLETT